MNAEELDKLYRLAERGLISKDQLDAVATQLANSDASTNGSRILDMLSILGETSDVSYAQVVQPFLQSDNETVAEVAMQVLCYSWNITEPYSDLILQWMKGEPFDTLGTGKLTAIDVAGSHLFQHSDPPMLAELIQALENMDNDDNLRSAAYLSIVRAMRGTAASHAAFAASSYGRLPVDSIFDPVVVREAKERLAREIAETQRG